MTAPPTTPPTPGAQTAAAAGDDLRSPGIDEIATLAEAALTRIPARFRRHFGNLQIRVEEFPDDETVAAMALDSPFDLLGLYRGVSLDVKSLSDPGPEADQVFLYRRPLLDYWCESGEALDHLVRHVLIHEIGHHFGLSDEDMSRIEANA